MARQLAQLGIEIHHTGLCWVADDGNGGFIMATRHQDLVESLAEILRTLS